jgi:hypothetical protein
MRIAVKQGLTYVPYKWTKYKLTLSDQRFVEENQYDQEIVTNYEAATP